MTPVASATLPFLADAGEGALFVTRLAAEAVKDSPTLVVEATSGLSAGIATPLWVLAGSSRLEVDTVAEVAPANAGDPVGIHAHPGRRPRACPLGEGFAISRVRRANPDNTVSTFRVGGASRLYVGAQVQADDGTHLLPRTVTGIAGDVVTLNQPFDHSVFETDRLSLVEAMVAAQFTDEAGSLVQETLGPVRFTAATTVDKPQSIESTLANSSQLVRAVRGNGLSANPAEFPVETHGGWLRLGNGDDNFGTLDTADFVGVDGGSGHRTGIVVAGGHRRGLDLRRPRHVVGHRPVRPDHALRDAEGPVRDPGPAGRADDEGVQQFRESYDTRYAALYYPWLVVPDPLGGPQAINVAPSGSHGRHLRPRPTVERGVHKAPANEVVRGIRVRRLRAGRHQARSRTC